jgi:non-heme chloroperoxidase
MPYLQVNGTGLYYEDDGAGQPVVLLHGWGTSGCVWGSQLPDLARNHRVITVDWRGCGRSARPAAGNSIGVFIDELIADQARYDPRRRLGELAVPVTFPHGALDAEIPRQVPEECAALIPGAEVVSIEGAGHMSQQDQPALFTRALCAALGRQPVRGQHARA